MLWAMQLESNKSSLSLSLFLPQQILSLTNLDAPPSAPAQDPDHRQEREAGGVSQRLGQLEAEPAQPEAKLKKVRAPLSVRASVCVR